MEDIKSIVGKKEKQWITEALREFVMEITLIKKDGTERVMRCTLNQSLLPFTEETEKAETKEKKVNDEVLAVYDIEAEGWRAFRWDSLTQIKLVLE